MRNAIGLPVGHAEGLVRGDGVRHEAPAPAQGHAAGALGIAAGGSGSLAKLQGSLGGMRIVYPSPSPTAAKMMPNPANIGGNIRGSTWRWCFRGHRWPRQSVCRDQRHRHPAQALTAAILPRVGLPPILLRAAQPAKWSASSRLACDRCPVLLLVGDAL